MIPRGNVIGGDALLPEIDRVREKLDPYHHDFRKIVLDAWHEWSRSRYAARWRTTRGRANFIWEEIIANAHEAFDGNRRVRLHKSPGSFWVIVDNLLVVRFKKAANDGISSNYPTPAALDFHDPQQPLPNIPVVQRVQVQYTLDAEALALADVSVVCRNGNSIEWSYSLLSLDLEIGSLPISSDSGPRTSLNGLLRPRTDAATYIPAKTDADNATS